MPNYDELIRTWKKRRSEGETLENIARDYPSQITRAHVHKMLYKGWEPTGAELRQKLGLPAIVPVIPVNGTVIPAGSQVHHADYCVKCSRPYISNHPLRRRCFVCSPYRGKK